MAALPGDSEGRETQPREAAAVTAPLSMPQDDMKSHTSVMDGPEYISNDKFSPVRDIQSIVEGAESESRGQ